MYALEQPSMALNDTPAPVFATMKITKTIQPEESVTQILGYVVNEATAQPGGKLKNLIFVCHGTPGELEMGIGITRNLTDRFKLLAPDDKPIVDVIYFHCCSVARIDGANTVTDGNLFCSEIAKNAKCQVIASTAVQQTGRYYLPYGSLDKFEGTVLVYGPEGNVLRSTTFPKFEKWSFDND